MKHRSRILKSLALLALILPAFVFSADREDVDPESMSTSVSQPTEQGDIGKEVELGSMGYVFDRYPAVYLPSSAHALAAVSAVGNEVELEDGSIWKISPYDGAKALQWEATDPLVIVQNTSWFSSYNFRIVNKGRNGNNSSIAANLFQGPFKGGEYSRYIAEIDYSRGLILLSDATHWELYPYDRANFFDWVVGEPVIIGQNGEYDANWNPYWEGMLINVRKTKKFVRAHQY